MANFAIGSYLAQTLPTELFEVVGGSSISRTFDKNYHNVARFIGSSQSEENDFEVDLKTADVVKNNIFEVIKKYPRSAEIEAEGSIYMSLLAEYANSLMAHRFLGGTIEDEQDEPSFRSPLRDLEDARDNIVTLSYSGDLGADLVKAKSLVRGSALENSAISVINPLILDTTDEFMKFHASDILKNSNILTPRWLSTSGVKYTIGGIQKNVKDNIVAFVTYPKSFAVTQLPEPIISKKLDLKTNQLIYRATAELAGMEVTEFATAIITKEAN